MPRDTSSPRDDESPKKFRITRKRLGTIRFIDDKGEFGFIEAEDFRDDVFFHQSIWQQPENFDPGHNRPRRDQRSFSDQRPQHRDSRPPRRDRHQDTRQPILSKELIGRHVEFEIDDDLFEVEKKLRATTVQLTKRPMGRRMTGRDATFNIVTHHPKARRKRPDWRK
ncbi:cold shock domain-containing protein [Roseiconus lacunae]|uniref:Cold shock domain-containing protein n=1 Tax=Roseiconus lacunae TaxID=2605694 RepID=A0ABT7PHD3_9BACT|nr:cold shock domain-containing protein [Roseiconus lacunae]MCD0460602.1 cold shock domain-containing protein [Roseiconus lacunae]MDM4015888.1 cold shock domain-containing protein [Roseiconus lacunae]WRQ52433.1 cold shock domain-containing protein [Stieleria sp. HD01]